MSSYCGFLICSMIIVVYSSSPDFLLRKEKFGMLTFRLNEKGKSPKVYKDCFLSFLFSSLLNSTPQLWRPAQSVR